jgi:hypothetical protein
MARVHGAQPIETKLRSWSGLTGTRWISASFAGHRGIRTIGCVFLLQNLALKKSHEEKIFY